MHWCMPSGLCTAMQMLYWFHMWIPHGTISWESLNFIHMISIWMPYSFAIEIITNFFRTFVEKFLNVILPEKLQIQHQTPSSRPSVILWKWTTFCRMFSAVFFVGLLVGGLFLWRTLGPLWEGRTFWRPAFLSFVPATVRWSGMDDGGTGFESGFFGRGGTEVFVKKHCFA